MRKAFKLLITLGTGLTITIAVVLLFALLPSLSKGNVLPQSATLVNGGFEGTYELWEGSSDRKIAPGWSLWYHDEGDKYDLPKAEDKTDFLREGAKSQFIFGRDKWSGYYGCLYQQVGGLIEDHYISFSAWAKADPDPDLDSPEKWRTMVGIDPSGGTNPQDINHYENSDLWDVYTDEGHWQQLSVVIKATSPTATVYACAHPSLPRPLYVWWDDATFMMTEESLVYIPIVLRDYYFLAPGELANPDMEEDWGPLEGYQVPIPDFDNVQVAPFWLPYWNDDYDPVGPKNKQPEFGPTGLNVGRDFRRHSGLVAQQIGSSGGGIFQAGIYQVVNGVRPGDTYSFTMWSHGWTQYWPSVNPTDERISDFQEPGGLSFTIGIDPYGGESFTSTNIIWTEAYDPYDVWYQFGVTATAMSNRISVWTQANPSNPALKSNESFWDDASLTVIEPSVNLGSSAYTVEEEAGPAQITVTLDVPSGQTVSVNYATSDGTAQAPEDYTVVSGTLVFSPGITSQVFVVPISDDTLAEDDETILLTLSEVSNATIGPTPSATLTILDNDPVVPDQHGAQ